MKKKVICIYWTADLSEIMAEPSCMEGSLCTAGLSKKSHLEFWITQMSV